MNIKEKLDSGEVVFGVMLSELSTPNLSRLFCRVGYDFLLMDCEHGYFDLTQAANLIAVAEGCSLPVLIRVPPDSRSIVGKYLDMGARGILLANVTGPEQTEEHVRQCLYAPQGRRGVSTFRAHTGYGTESTGEMLKKANEKNLVLVQVESAEAVESIEEILSVPGLDGVMIGPNDLTQDMGLLGRYDHPLVLQALHRVAEAAQSCGKWSGVITGNEALLLECRNLGMCCFSVGSELSILARGAENQLSRLRALMKRTAETVPEGRG